jgi:hypothetical protein
LLITAKCDCMPVIAMRARLHIRAELLLNQAEVFELHA